MNQPDAEPKSPSSQATDQSVTKNLETENLIETYQIIAEWIRFADAKAAVVLTAAGALASLLIPTFKPFLERDPGELPFAWWRFIVIGLFFGWLLVTGGSCFWAFMCINPTTNKGKHPAIGRCNHFHPAAISAKYSLADHGKFVSDYEKLGSSGLMQEVLQGLLVDSHISSTKYFRVSRAIRMLAVSAILGIFYSLAIQL